MPGIIEYIIKLNICLAIVYLFYQLLLRQLTFYNWNRWYLLGYTALSFIIPLINIMPSLQKQNLQDTAVMQWIPAIRFSAPVQQNFLATLSWWHWMAGVVILGAIILLTRLTFRLYSFYRIKRKAELISGEGTKIYQLDEDITPFSFGNSIFINTNLHNGDELEEIIRHEFVHIKQKHTVDIIWCELFCIVNWFNPFVWLLKHSVKQNLEFIADDKVLQNGIDKTTYQYLLLKVVGHPQLAFTNHFNFSSLKKRIAMMNTLKTARIHLARFAFLLPVLAVLLLSFRNESQPKQHMAEKATPIVLDVVGYKIPDLTSDVKPASERKQNEAVEKKLSGPYVSKFNKIDTTQPDAIKTVKLTGTVAGFNVSQDTVPVKRIQLLSNGNDGVIYLVDGVRASQEKLSTLNANTIQSVSVFKGLEATALYGPDAVNGLISIVTKPVKHPAEVSISAKGEVVVAFRDMTLTADSVRFTPAPVLQLSNVPEQPKLPTNLPDDIYYILNGEKSSRRKIEKINPDNIESIDVLKGENAQRFYGKKGKNGVIVVTTKP